MWLKGYGEGRGEGFNSLEPTADGGLIAAGKAEWAKGPGGRRAGNDRALIVKFDGEGGIEFERELAGSDSDWAMSALQTSDGGYAVMGVTGSGDGDFKAGPGKSAGRDVFLAKLDPVGEPVWVRTYGGKLDESAGGFLEEPDGGFLFVGTAESVGAGKGCADTPDMQPQLFAVKVDRDGRETSSSCRGLRNGVRNVKLVRAPGGYALLLGTAMDRGGGDSFAFAGSLGPDAGISGLREIPAGGTRMAFAASAVRGGGLAGAGCMGTDAGNAREFCPAAWLFALSSGLELQWERYWPGERETLFNGVARSKGGFVAAGQSSSPLASKASGVKRGGASADHKAYIVMADSGGAPLWETALGGSGWQKAETAAALADGGVAVAGETNSPDGDFSGAYRELRPPGRMSSYAFIARFAPRNEQGQGVEASGAVPE
jgi:hypothetical protein